MAVRVIRKLRLLYDVVFTRPDASAVQDGDVLTYVLADDKFYPAAPTGGGGGGAPTTLDYLVGTASGSLSNEIVAGTTPGGELGGTWGSPTVDAVHSGSSHAAVQAAAEATAAAALTAHDADTSVHGIADTTVLATDAEVAAAVTASEAGQVRDGDAAGGVLSGTFPNPGFAADMATQAELDGHINDAVDAHDASAVSIVDTGGFYTGTEVEAALQEIGAALGVSASGDAVVQDITQNAHGLSVGDWVRRSGASFVVAQADSVANAEVYGVVSAVADANNFTLTTHGLVTGLSGLTNGVAHFLSPSSAGDIQAAPPVTPGEISKPVLLALSTTSGIVANMRGMVVGGIGAGDSGGNSLAYLRDEKAANTAGGATSTGSFIRRVLNTEVYDPDGLVTLDAVTNIGRFTLGAGEYRLVGQAPFFKSERTRLKFRDITNSADLGLGQNVFIGSGGIDGGYATVQTPWFTLAASTDVELQYRVGASDGLGLGAETNFGVTEVYAEVWIEKRVSGGGGGELVWIPMTYRAVANAWSDYGGPPYFPMEYAKDANWVYIRGMAAPDGALSEPFEPLPVGYRPSQQAFLIGYGGTADVQTDGRILFFGSIGAVSCWINERIPL